MNLLLIVLKASCVMGAAAMVNALRYRRSSASFRHLVWTLAVAGLLALPVLSAGLPGWQVALPAAFAPETAVVAPGPDTPEIASPATAAAGAAEATNAICLPFGLTANAPAPISNDVSLTGCPPTIGME